MCIRDRFQAVASLNRELFSSESEYAWQDVIEDQDTARNSFMCYELPGIKHYPLCDSSPPMSYFRLCFTASVIEMFVKYTNRFAERFDTENIQRLKTIVEIRYGNQSHC